MTNNSLHLDNSESSAAEDREDNLSTEEKNVRIFAKQMLQGRLFIGHFQERRLVEPLQAYRDVIVVNESEFGLKNDMDIVRKRLKTFYTRSCWIGITDPTFVGAPNGHSFWVDSSHNTFGYYWYKIKSVRFKRKEISFRLKVVRPMTETDNQIQTQIMTNDASNTTKDITFDAIFENFKNTSRETAIWFFTEALTAENIKQVFTFVSILLATLATSTVYGVGYLMEFALKLIHEISVFIHASTPVMIAVVNLIGKIIGGFYILIAMLWKGSPKPSQHGINYQPRHRAIEMPRYRNREPLTISEAE